MAAPPVRIVSEGDVYVVTHRVVCGVRGQDRWIKDNRFGYNDPGYILVILFAAAAVSVV
ncbi:MAG: hypothetical protein ACOX1I_08625 [Dethiobacteria bacterium]